MRIDISSNNCISVKKETGERCAFLPGQWEALRSYAPELDSVFPGEWSKVLDAWTADAIYAWEKLQKELATAN